MEIESVNPRTTNINCEINALCVFRTCEKTGPFKRTRGLRGVNKSLSDGRRLAALIATKQVFHTSVQ